MSHWLLICGVVIGILIGRAYGWMKYRYPESREMINLKVAKLRAERAQAEEETERIRRRIDDSLDERMGVR